MSDFRDSGVDFGFTVSYRYSRTLVRRPVGAKKTPGRGFLTDGLRFGSPARGTARFSGRFRERNGLT